MAYFIIFSLIFFIVIFKSNYHQGLTTRELDLTNQRGGTPVWQVACFSLCPKWNYNEQLLIIRSLQLLI